MSKSAITHALAGSRVPARPILLQLATVYGAEADEWGRLWDAYDNARRTTRAQAAAARRAARPPRACAVDGCPNQPHPTLCTTHQAHKQLYGDPTAGNFRSKTHAAVCSVEGCERRYYSLELCRMHDERHRRARQGNDISAQAGKQVVQVDHSLGPGRGV